MNNITKSFFLEFFDDDDLLNLYHISQEDANEIGKDSIRFFRDELHLIQDVIKSNVVNPISFAKPMLKHGETGIIYSNKINIIKGEAGAHKRWLLETLCSALLSKQGIENRLGFSKNQLDPIPLLYVDTERDILHELPFDLQQISINAGYSKGTLPSNFFFLPLKEIAKEIRFEALRRHIRIKDANPNYHLLIVLNVSSGCIPNSNNPEHARKLLNLMNDAVNKSNCTFLCVINENPGSEKPSGHLESLLVNMSSTIMHTQYVKRNNQATGLIKLKFLKPGNTKTPASIFCKYSEAVKGLVLAENNEEQKSADEEEDLGDDLPFW